MAFMLYGTDDGHVPAWEYQKIKAGVKPEVGTGMAHDAAGKMVVSATPTHICMMFAEAALAADTEAPFVKIAADQVWENVFYMSPLSTISPGMALGLDDGGKYVDPDNTSDKVFSLTYVAGQSMGDTVRGRFVK